MKFGLLEFAKGTLNSGKLVKSSSIKLNKINETRELDQSQIYKYLVITDQGMIQYTHMKMKIEKEYFRRVRFILKAVLNAKNKRTLSTLLPF